ncbi:polyferredoxin [Breznakia pachnodae]|uniref:Polyferredoxin n=1 Tax=Breznakia pachnodae TaxID=265178 RepID=A0ABU0E6F8_9FIRM|nr:polyferredoxin [Breznakia pachnodae]
MLKRHKYRSYSFWNELVFNIVFFVLLFSSIFAILYIATIITTAITGIIHPVVMQDLLNAIIALAICIVFIVPSAAYVYRHSYMFTS